MVFRLFRRKQAFIADSVPVELGELPNCALRWQ